MHSSGQPFSESTRLVLERSGWFPGRNVVREVREWQGRLEREGFRMFSAAESALREFGGIRVEVRGPGIEAAREAFHLDPMLADDFELLSRYGRNIGTDLYPLGEAGRGHVFLAIGEDGRVFALMDEMWLLGNSITEAIEALVAGRVRSLSRSADGRLALASVPPPR